MNLKFCPIIFHFLKNLGTGNWSNGEFFLKSSANLPLYCVVREFPPDGIHALGGFFVIKIFLCWSYLVRRGNALGVIYFWFVCEKMFERNDCDFILSEPNLGKSPGVVDFVTTLLG